MSHRHNCIPSRERARERKEKSKVKVFTFFSFTDIQEGLKMCLVFSVFFTFTSGFQTSGQERLLFQGNIIINLQTPAIKKLYNFTLQISKLLYIVCSLCTLWHPSLSSLHRSNKEPVIKYWLRFRRKAYNKLALSLWIWTPWIDNIAPPLLSTCGL